MAQNQEKYQDHLFQTSLRDVFEAFKQYVARHPIPPSFLEHLPEDRLPFYWQNMVSAGPHPGNVRAIVGPSPITPSDVPGNQDQARRQQQPPLGPSSGSQNPQEHGWQQPPLQPGPSSGNWNLQEHGRQQQPPLGPSSGIRNPQEHGWQQPPPPEPSSGIRNPQEHGRQQPPLPGPSSGIRNPQEHGRSSSPQGDRERYDRHDRDRIRSPPDRGKGGVRRSYDRSSSPQGDRERYDRHDRDRIRSPPDRGKGGVRGRYDREDSRSPRDRGRRSRERNRPRRRSREGSPVRRSHERRRSRSPVGGRERTRSPARGRRRSRSPLFGRSRSRHHDRDRSITPPRARGGERVEHRVSQPAGGDRRISPPDAGNESERSRSGTPRARGGERGDRRIPHPMAGNESDSERRRSSSPVSTDDVFQTILPRFHEEFENMLERPIEPLPAELYDMLNRTKTEGLCAEYHEQVQVERKIHEKLINSAGIVFSYIAEQNEFAVKEQTIIDGFPSMTPMNESLANITQREKDILAKTVNVLNSMHNAVDPATIIMFDSQLTKFQREMERVREQRQNSIQQREVLNARRIKMAEEILQTVKAARAADDNFNRQHDGEHRNVMDELRAARMKREDVQRKLNAAFLQPDNS